jgi:hypothetical protein
MIQIPADLGQRILDAARIAAAMHEQSGATSDRDATVHAGGAGRTAVMDHDGRLNAKDAAPAPRLCRWWSRAR